MPSSGQGKNSASLNWFLPKAAPFGAAFGIRFDSHDTKKEMHPERVHLFFGGANESLVELTPSIFERSADLSFPSSLLILK